MKSSLLLVLACLLSAAQPRDPADDPLEKAYQALRIGNYQEAIDQLHRAALVAPERASIPKELGYAYLKIGNEDAAREMFEQALRLAPDDFHTALQLAFSYRQAGRLPRAAELLERVRQRGDAHFRREAERALRNLPGGEQAGPVPAPSPTPASGDVLEAPAAPSQPASDSLQATDPLQATLDRAYQALKAQDYEAAIEGFGEAIRLAPSNSNLHKDLGYAHLKTGATEAALDVFEQALGLAPGDEQLALEIGFLRYETGRQAGALALFGELLGSSNLEVRQKAQTAHQKIDQELRQGIKRWSAALELDPTNRSVQLELAELYEKHGEPAKAARHYLEAWILPAEERPDEILLGLARARDAAGDEAGARAAWLLASRSSETRVAELARERLPDRFPYASEFRAALDLDPLHTALRRDLAYLLLEVKLVELARQEFEIVVEQNPDDLLSAAQLADIYLARNNVAEAVKLLERARASPDDEIAGRARQTLRKLREDQARPHRELGEKSLKRSYLNDARREFLRAYQLNPEDLTVALKLGVVHNLLRDDREAIRWFGLAAASDDPRIAQQALQSHRNLAPQFRRFATTVWTLPIYSTRYHDLFNYAQIKTEMRLDAVPLYPYLSLRFAGDVRQRSGGPAPQFLSESSMIAGLGVRSEAYRGVTLWGEAGEAFHLFRERPEGVPRAGPDFRGGLNWFRNIGATLGDSTAGWFFETNVDAVYLSRFDDDVIAYGQLRPGYRLPDRGWFKALVFFNFNVTTDLRRAYWANYAELGPGLRFRVPGASPPMDLAVHLLRGAHLVNEFNPRRPNYYDLRLSLWYSFAR